MKKTKEEIDGYFGNDKYTVVTLDTTTAIPTKKIVYNNSDINKCIELCTKMDTMAFVSRKELIEHDNRQFTSGFAYKNMEVPPHYTYETIECIDYKNKQLKRWER